LDAPVVHACFTWRKTCLTAPLCRDRRGSTAPRRHHRRRCRQRLSNPGGTEPDRAGWGGKPGTAVGLLHSAGGRAWTRRTKSSSADRAWPEEMRIAVTTRALRHQDVQYVLLFAVTIAVTRRRFTVAGWPCYAYTWVGGVAQWLAAFVAGTKSTHVGRRQYLDG